MRSAEHDDDEDFPYDLKLPPAPGVDDAMEFGEMVRARRKALGLRQADIAHATGMGRRYIVDLEKGKPTLWLGPALMIARYLGIKPDFVKEVPAAPSDALPEWLPDDEA
ncbi:helix-turn-helix transcriptional regulator [Maricaulis maris]|uniref:helix-turn-helix transcriptional regulator n=1 Tax=Maricaulis maris TaxID=74318 RepID=UPI003A9104B9